MKTTDKKDWTEAVNNEIDMPDCLTPLFNKFGMQMRFHTISGKNEFQTICDMISLAQDFFDKHPEAIKAGKE